MDPSHQWEPEQTDFRAPMIVHVRSRSRTSPMGGPFEAVSAGLNHSFQAQMRRWVALSPLRQVREGHSPLSGRSGDG